LFLHTLQEGLPSSIKSLRVWTNQQCCGTVIVNFWLSGTGTGTGMFYASGFGFGSGSDIKWNIKVEKFKLGGQFSAASEIEKPRFCTNYFG
jgi:hypothetical protein